MRKVGTFILDAYIAILLAALLLGPILVLHGYRAWWLDIFYAVIVIATIGGIISHYRITRPNGGAHGHQGHVEHS